MYNIFMNRIISSIYNKYSDIKYGWIDSKGIIHSHINEGLAKNFCFQSPDKLKKTRVGICWETAELTRSELLLNNIKCNSYFFVIPNGKFYCHSIIVANVDNKYYWIENSFINCKGIHEFDSMDEIFKTIIDKFNLIVNDNNVDKSKIKIYEYDTPNFGIGCVLFYFHCFRGKKIKNIYF